MIIKNNLVVVFDLDDTLFQEIDFLKSAFNEISNILSKDAGYDSKALYNHMLACYQSDGNAFQSVLDTYNIQNFTVIELVQMYRNHYPNIKLSDNTGNVLDFVKTNVHKIGLITDGRTLQQQNKLKALGLQDYFDDIVISESFGSSKPDLQNFKYFETLFGEEYQYIYIGDNTNKDFIAPNALGWITICLKDKGLNIHKQSFTGELSKQPQHIINLLEELPALIFKLQTRI